MENKKTEFNFGDFIESTRIFDGCVDKDDLKRKIAFPYGSEPQMENNDYCAYIFIQSLDDFVGYGEEASDYENRKEKEIYDIIETLEHSQLSYIAPKFEDFFVAENCSLASYMNMPKNIDP